MSLKEHFPVISVQILFKRLSICFLLVLNVSLLCRLPWPNVFFNKPLNLKIENLFYQQFIYQQSISLKINKTGRSLNSNIN